MKNKIFLTVIILMILTLYGCGKEKKTEPLDSGEGLIIKNPWFRPGALNRNSALYFEIYNNTDRNDTLYDVKSDLAKVVQIHETYEKGNNMKGMRHVEFVEIPARSKLEFKPGGFHIMLVGLTKDLKPGDAGEVTLLFKGNGKVRVRAEVSGK